MNYTANNLAPSFRRYWYVECRTTEAALKTDGTFDTYTGEDGEKHGVMFQPGNDRHYRTRKESKAIERARTVKGGKVRCYTGLKQTTTKRDRKQEAAVVCAKLQRKMATARLYASLRGSAKLANRRG